MKISQPIPKFSLMSNTAGKISPTDLLGTRYIIFIYPKDDTYG